VCVVRDIRNLISFWYNKLPLQNRGWVAAIALSILMLSSFNMIPLISYQQQDTQSLQANSTTSTIAPPPQAALTSVIVEPTNNLFGLESHYVVVFTTATTGTIKTIAITFPAGFGVGTTKLIESSGIGAGTISISTQTVTYTVNSPVSVPAGTKIMIILGKITNGLTVTNTLSITTKDPSSVTIDGPTISPAFTLKTVATNMIASGAVLTAKIANSNITAAKMAPGSVNSAAILDGSITKADVAAGSGIVTGAQSCLGKLVAGFDSSGNEICKSISFVRDSTRTVDNVGDVGLYTSIAIGTDGFPIISYYDATNGDLKVIHCSIAICSPFNNPETPDSVGNVGQFTSIAIGTDGFPILSYYDVTNQDLKAVHCTSTTCSTHDVPVTIDSLGTVGQYTSIVIGTDGFPMISYWDGTNNDLKAVHCASASCVVYTKLTLDSTGDVGAYTSIAIGTDGFPIISYYDLTNQDLKAVHCTSATCFSQDSPMTIDSTGNVGLYTSIAKGSDGFPVISYNDINGVLKLVHCTSATCSTHDTPKTFDDDYNPLALGTSLAIGKDGFPIISYAAGTNVNAASLKVIHCTSVTCSTDDIPETLDDSNAGGTYTSIKIGTEGFPVISYRDVTNDHLKMALVGGIILS